MASSTLSASPQVRITELSRFDLHEIAALNQVIFQEQRIINRIDHEHLVVLLLTLNGMRAGFKIGYGQERGIFYSAKGGVLPRFRRRGFAAQLTDAMVVRAAALGYQHLRFDTFPNQHPGMIHFALQHGFSITDAGWNEQHRDYRVTLTVSIPEYLVRREGLLLDDGQ